MLPRTLRSVLKQTERDFEVIIVDDGSTDETVQMVEAMNLPDNFRFFARPHAGRSAARNYALSQARAERIAFLDSDDEYLPDTLEIQHRILDQFPDYGLVNGGGYYVDRHGKYFSWLAPAPPSGSIYDEIACYVPHTMFMPTVMVRREILERAGEFDVSLDRFEDIDMWRRISKITKIYSVQRPLCRICAHEEHLAIDGTLLFKQVNAYGQKVLREDREDYPQCAAMVANLYTYYGWAVWLHESFTQAIPFYQKAAGASGSESLPRALTLMAKVWAKPKVEKVGKLSDKINDLARRCKRYPFYQPLKKTYIMLRKIRTKLAAIRNRFRGLPIRSLPARIKYMATTGEGTDACYAAGALPMQVHFYSPVPDLKDLEERSVWDRVSTLPGVEFRRGYQKTLLAKLGQWGPECDWPVKGDPVKPEFFTNNGSFCFGCAAVAHSMIRMIRPRRIIEIGSGNSTLVLRKALEDNRNEFGDENSYIAVDPYPRHEIAELLIPGKELLTSRVELLEPSFFDQLDANDILFIDSGHTVRTGSDVNFLFLEVLPRLRPGVVVHVHDISLPYEYPKVYFTNPSFRVFWTESYLLQAFLTYNDRFDVLLSNQYLMTDEREAFGKTFEHYDPENKHPACSGGFWMRRKPEPDGTDVLDIA